MVRSPTHVPVPIPISGLIPVRQIGSGRQCNRYFKVRLHGFMGGPGGGVVAFSRHVESFERRLHAASKQFTTSLGRLPGCKIIGKAQKGAEPAGMMLADPDLIIIQTIKELDELKITAERQRRIHIQRMMRSQKKAKPQRAGSYGSLP